MPLLSNKVYVQNKTKKKDEDTQFYLPLTNEQCENQEELERKIFLYNQKIWTCKITGQINLTFKEALKSEQSCSKMLKNTFKKCFEAAVLQFVHHNKECLDMLVHKAWTFIHQEFCIHEPVSIKLTSPKEITLEGIVVKVDRSREIEDKEVETSPNKLNSDASSSDKENKKKFVPLKKKYYYSVKIYDMNKLVNDIPSDKIERTLRPPSKDQIRMFIRAHALRHLGKQYNPWVVEEDLVKKYKLPVLEPEFTMDKHKLKELSKTAEIQMYNKLTNKEDATVDLTRSDDESENNISRKNIEGKNSARKLKQTTLFDIRSSSASAGVSRQSSKTLKSPFSSPTRNLPPLAQKLFKLIKDNPNDPTVRSLIFKCAQLFSDQQISKFPEIIKGQIKEKKEKLDEKRKVAAMTPEQRETYYAEKRNSLRKQNRDKKRELNIKIEDSELKSCKPIPKGILISVDGLTQDQWSRLLSVSEFTRCYRKLLNADGEGVKKGLNVNDLCAAVVETNDVQLCLLASLVCMLLKPLHQDSGISEKKELGLQLSNIPVTSHTAGELLRIILPLASAKRLKKSDENNLDDERVDPADDILYDFDVKVEENLEIIRPICDKLSNKDLHDLSVDEKIRVLELLQGKVLELDTISNFIEDHQREVVEAYKRKLSETKEYNDRLKIVRMNKSEMAKLIDPSQISQQMPADNSTLGISACDSSKEEHSMAMKRRQSIEARLKEQEEKEKRIEKERQYQKLEKEEGWLKKAIDQCQKSYNKACVEAKQLLRVQPLGYDRHFRRYWYFETAAKGIYAESDIGEIGNSEQIQSRWVAYLTLDEINNLVSSFSDKGIRESALKQEIESLIPKLKEGLQQHTHDSNDFVNNGGGNKCTDCDKDNNYTTPYHLRGKSDEYFSPTDSYVLRGFKKDLQETEYAIRHGSLGGVESYETWLKTLIDAVELEQLKELLISVFLGVHDRFLNAPLKSSTGRSDFLNSVDKARTVGRLCVLQKYLDACVSWNKSATDEKCRICRKSNEENRMLLCDGCNHAFHLFCLRPPLRDVPDGEWFCSKCRPVNRVIEVVGVSDIGSEQSNKRMKTRKGGYNNNSEDSEKCSVCKTRGEEPLAKCTSCQSCFHSYCHEPPLRQIRRLNWHCSDCRLEESATSKSKPSRQCRNSANNRQSNTVSEEESDIEENVESTPEKVMRKPSKRKTPIETAKTNGMKSSKKSKAMINCDNEDEGSSDYLENHYQQRATRSGRNSRINYSESNEMDEEEEEDENDDAGNVDESDQDVDNLSSLMYLKRQKRKRNSDSNLDHSDVGTPVKKRKIGEAYDKVEKACQSIIKQLYNHKNSWPFREPVDEKEVPDYYSVIKTPICLADMMNKRKNGDYGGSSGLKKFLADVGLMFYNAEVYNEPDSDIILLAESLEEHFKYLYEKCDLGVPYQRSLAENNRL